MITDGKKWHYLALKSLPTFNETRKKWFNLAVKSLSALLGGTTSNHSGDFYCLNCCHSYSTKKKRLEKHEGGCNDHDNCDVEMPNEDNKILEYKHGEKSLKAPFIDPADSEYLLEKIHSCQNNPEKSYTEKKAKHTLSCYSWFTCCSYDASKNELGYYKGKDCMESFCKDLRENAMKIINYEKKKKKNDTAN